MKKLIVIMVAGLTAISLVSCKKYLDDVAVSPNEPENASPRVLLAGLEMATFLNYTGTNARRAGVFVQQLAGTGFQMSDVHNYIVVESDVDNDWQTIYSGALANAEKIIDDHGAANPYYNGIAKVLKAMNLGLAADMWGDVPSKNIAKGPENLNPTFENQQVVYADVQQLLTEAIADLQKPVSANKFLPTNEDYMFAGDVSRWIQTAYVLKARYANRLSNRSPGTSASDALSFLQSAYAAGYDSSATAFAVFGAGGNESNQWANFNAARADYIKMGAFFIDTLDGMADPRLPFYADEVSGGGYAGGDLANPDAATSSDIGPYLDTEDASVPMISYAEAKFIEAEAALRSGNSGQAATAHNEGVIASLQQVTGDADAVYVAAHASETGATITLQKIMLQKYIALFGEVEAWTDWRRTKLPVLQPNPVAALGGIPRRLPTPRDERTYNPNAIVNTNILQAVWFE